MFKYYFLRKSHFIENIIQLFRRDLLLHILLKSSVYLTNSNILFTFL